MVWYSLMQPINRLVYQFNWCFQFVWAQHFYYLLVYLVYCERLVYVAYTVTHQLLRLKQLKLARLVHSLKQVLHASFLYQLHCCTEYAELLKAWHIYAIIVWIAYLRSLRHDDYLLRMQTVEYTQDTLLERCASNYRVVYHHKVVYVRFNASVCYVVHM